MPNEVGGMETALPEEVAGKMKALLAEYNSKEEKTLDDILEFHAQFEKIHPFQEKEVTKGDANISTFQPEGADFFMLFSA